MNNNPTSKYVQAVAVNHNTSKYTELMLRSLFTRHPAFLDFSVTVFDNGSQDDTRALEDYTQENGVAFLPSGFELKTEFNSHGEILRRFVLEHSDCVYYLFLDADTCFIEHDTLNTMIQELEQDPGAFGIAQRLSSNSETEISSDYWKTVYDSRLHPCCALVKNTTTFRQVVEDIGLSCVKYLWANHEEYLDTFQLMSRAMKTHKFSHILSSKLVLHFFSVSYNWEPPDVMAFKAGLRDRLLEELRSPARG
jgi:Glycosyl transferase family 2